MPKTRTEGRAQSIPAESPQWSFGGNMYRSFHKVLVDGVHRGFIVMEHGYGKPYELHPISQANQAMPAPGSLMSVRTKRASDGDPFKVLLEEAVTAADAGMLPTVEEHRARCEKAAQDDEKRRQEAAKRTEEDAKEWAALRGRLRSGKATQADIEAVISRAENGMQWKTVQRARELP